eukprot:c22977_g2_i1 orf=204-1928(+)
MRMSEDLQSGSAVLCMPRDLFKVGGHSGASTYGATGTHESAGLQKKNENISSPRMAMQGLAFLLPPPSAPILHHHTSTQAPSPQTTAKNVVVPIREDWTVKGIVPSTDISLDGTSPGSSSNWCFQVVASLRADSCSLASDVIAAIDFDETGSRFATGGIARKIRVCSYTDIANDQQSEASSREEEIDEDDFEEERQLLGPHGSGRSLGKSRIYCGSKRKKPETEGSMILQNHDQAALRIICTPSKLSSLKWRPLGSNVIGCGDYDGVVTEWDVEQGLCLSERYEHSGQRIWSVDYSAWFPTLCASASGDGTVRLWTLNCEKSVGVIRSPGRNSICCAEFSSDGPHRVAVACADSNVYIYDVRRLDMSLLCLQGHERAASYVRFMGSEELVSASIDSTVKLWDVSNAALACNSGSHDILGTMSSRVGGSVSGTHPRLVDDEMRQRSRGGGVIDKCRLRKTFDSHRNVKNFIGLSVWKEGGLIACGSESNEVFVYERSSKEPVWKMKFPPISPIGRRRWQYSASSSRGSDLLQEEEMDERGGSNGFVGAVCWREQDDHTCLLTANSQGTLELVKVW